MAMPTIEELVIAPTAEECLEKLFDICETVQLPARSWRKGGVARTILTVVAVLMAQFMAVVAANVAAGFLAFATGKYLTAHARDVYGIDRIEATFATGEVTLTNSGGAIYNIGADELIVRSTITGARFRVTEAFVLGANSSVTVDVQALESGSASSVAPGEINALETTLARVTVLNSSSVIGFDAESDAELKARCEAQRGTWSVYGPRDAYLAAALGATLTDGSPTNIRRVKVSTGSSVGFVTVVCATASGAPTGDELDAVEENIEKLARPDTVNYEVLAATPLPVSQTLTLWARGGTADILTERAEAALDSLIETYPIGGIAKIVGGAGYLYADRVAAAVISSSPEFFDVDGASDVALASTEVVVSTYTLDLRILSS